MRNFMSALVAAMDMTSAEAAPKITYSALNEIVWTSAASSWVIPLEHMMQPQA